MATPAAAGMYNRAKMINFARAVAANNKRLPQNKKTVAAFRNHQNAITKALMYEARVMYLENLNKNKSVELVQAEIKKLQLLVNGNQAATKRLVNNRARLKIANSKYNAVGQGKPTAAASTPAGNAIIRKKITNVIAQLEQLNTETKIYKDMIQVFNHLKNNNVPAQTVSNAIKEVYASFGTSKQAVTKAANEIKAAPAKHTSTATGTFVKNMKTKINNKGGTDALAKYKTQFTLIIQNGVINKTKNQQLTNLKKNLIAAKQGNSPLIKDIQRTQSVIAAISLNGSSNTAKQLKQQRLTELRNKIAPKNSNNATNKNKQPLVAAINKSLTAISSAPATNQGATNAAKKNNTKKTWPNVQPANALKKPTA